MRTTTFFAAGLAAVAGVSAQETPDMPNAPLLPAAVFIAQPKFAQPVPLIEAATKLKNITGSVPEEVTAVVGPVSSIIKTVTNSVRDLLNPRATCSNPRVRQEWDSMSNNDRQGFVNGVKCLMSHAPSGQFSASRSRYEDFVALHQTLTPNVHGNSKFLIWHRYLLWTFEDVMRSECGFSGPMPWFDETRYQGNFRSSSIFSSQWFGSFTVNGCVTDGQFANLAINIGPGAGNTRHCLSRNGNDGNTGTGQISSGYVAACNAYGDYGNQASCSETGPHAYGHNGIGGVMQDVYASPADPLFWLHHAFVDRNFRIWQNGNSARQNSISGTDHFGNQLTLSTTVNVYDIRPTVRIGDIIQTTSTLLCYKYNY